MQPPKNRNMPLIIVISAVTCRLALAQESAWPKHQLEFETTKETLHWTYPDALPDAIQPTHVAVVHFHWGSTKPIKIDYPGHLSKKILGTEIGRTLSKHQQSFLGRGEGKHATAHDIRIGKPAEYLLYAVSENDARRMAEAAIQIADTEARSRLQKELEDARQIIAQAPQIIAQLESQLQQIESNIAAIKNDISYPDEKEALADKYELDKVLRSLDVEVAGIRARIDAAKKLKCSGDTAPAETLAELDRLLITQEIELACALARKQVVEVHHKKARDFIDLTANNGQTAKELHGRRRELTRAKDDLPKFEQLLATDPQVMTVARVVDKKVMIHPVHGTLTDTPAP